MLSSNFKSDGFDNGFLRCLRTNAFYATGSISHRKFRLEHAPMLANPLTMPQILELRLRAWALM